MFRRLEFRHARQLVGALALAVVSVCGLVPASAEVTVSSTDDRARLVAVTRNLEKAPLQPDLQANREWAVKWLTEAPDVSVTVCAEPLGGLVQSDYAYANEILVQYIFAMGARIIEHPEAANDPNAQQLAGVESALIAYRSILRDKPDAKSPALEGLLQTQAQGELPGFVRKAYASCTAKK